jgi:hypothetical protein
MSLCAFTHKFYNLCRCSTVKEFSTWNNVYDYMCIILNYYAHCDGDVKEFSTISFALLTIKLLPVANNGHYP